MHSSLTDLLVLDLIADPAAVICFSQVLPLSKHRSPLLLMLSYSFSCPLCVYPSVPFMSAIISETQLNQESEFVSPSQSQSMAEIAPLSLFCNTLKHLCIMHYR